MFNAAIWKDRIYQNNPEEFKGHVLKLMPLTGKKDHNGWVITANVALVTLGLNCSMSPGLNWCIRSCSDTLLLSFAHRLSRFNSENNYEVFRPINSCLPDNRVLKSRWKLLSGIQFSSPRPTVPHCRILRGQHLPAGGSSPDTSVPHGCCTWHLCHLWCSHVGEKMPSIAQKKERENKG